MTEDEVKRLERTVRDAKALVERNICAYAEKMKKEILQNSISHLELSLEKYLEKSLISDLDNVYHHIGKIQAASNYL